MKCLVTGCAGFIGSHLEDRLLGLGYEIQQKILHDCYSTLQKANKKGK
jgi:UDP-glucose 4-epimerase